MTEPAPTVFVVDDDSSLRRAIKRLVESVGVQVELFGSAHEFLQAKRPDAPSCLVLDIRLPGISGLEFQRELAYANIPTPIIFITAHGDIPMTVRAMKAGAVEFLTKPFRDQDILDAVQIALERDRARRTQDKSVHGGSDEQANRGRTRRKRDHREGASRQRDEKDGRTIVGRSRKNGRRTRDS